MREAQRLRELLAKMPQAENPTVPREFSNSQSALQNSARGNASLFPKSDEPLQVKPSYYIVGDYDELASVI
jgi:hypothetical protein